ncbi:hypothetical protein [Actinophytocola sp.]|uniref:hypothetical protein n=1 Tax=Actinophytocola sp. TaxID=1872138 RepID=UPI003D6B99DA
MPINVTEVIQEFIRNLLTDRNFAVQYAGDQHGMLAAQGVTDHDLSAVDMQAAVGAACADPSVPQEVRSAVQSGYSGGGGPGSAAGHTQSVEQVIQHLNYVTYQTYEGDDYITNLIDNSVDNSVDIEGNVFGDVDVNNASGDGSQIIDGDNLGQANTGDGAVLAGDDASGVNTGVNTGINAGGDVENAVVGDDNQTAQVQGSADGTVFNFGGGDVSNVSGNTLEEGSAIASGGGDASGTNIDVEDNDTNVITEVTDSHDTVTAIQDNDNTVNEDNDIVVVEDNDTAVSGDDTLAAQ